MKGARVNAIGSWLIMRAIGHPGPTGRFLDNASALTDREGRFRMETLRADIPHTLIVQMERLVNELSARVETNYLVTPRTGPAGRFFPTKTREDLDRIREDPSLAARYASV